MQSGVILLKKKKKNYILTEKLTYILGLPTYYSFCYRSELRIKTQTKIKWKARENLLDLVLWRLTCWLYAIADLHRKSCK